MFRVGQKCKRLGSLLVPRPRHSAPPFVAEDSPRLGGGKSPDDRPSDAVGARGPGARAITEGFETCRRDPGHDTRATRGWLRSRPGSTSCRAWACSVGVNRAQRAAPCVAPRMLIRALGPCRFKLSMIEMNRLRRPVPTRDPLQGGDEARRFPIPGRVRQVPAGLRLDDAVDVRRALPHVLVVLAGDPARRHRPARSARAAQRHRAFIEASRRAPGIVRTGEHVQHVLHAPDVLSVQRRDAPHFFSATASARGARAPGEWSRAPRRRQSPDVGSPRWLRGPSTAHSRPGAGHRPSPQSPPADGCRAASVASAVGRRSAPPCTPRSTYRQPTRRTSRGYVPMACGDVGERPLRVEQLQHADPLPRTRRSPRARRAFDRRGTGDPWHSSGGRESADVVDEDFIHSVRSQLPIRGKHSDHRAAVEALEPA